MPLINASMQLPGLAVALLYTGLISAQPADPQTETLNWNAVPRSACRIWRVWSGCSSTASIAWSPPWVKGCGRFPKSNVV